MVHVDYCKFHIVIQSILFYSVTATAAVESDSTNYGYGSPCQSDTTCQNYSLLLTCNHGTGLCECVVAKKGAVILDDTMNQCQVIAGMSCYRQKPVGPDDDDYYYTPEYTYVPCTRHASCQMVNFQNPNNKICTCDPEYYANDDGRCVEKKDYGEHCQNMTAGPLATDQCNSNRYFICTSAGVCGCSTDFEYDSALNTCFKPIGSNCKLEVQFRNPIFHGRFDSCPLNADCFKGICQCRPGFSLGSDQSCHLAWGKACNETKACSDYQFICRNGSCQCKFPLHQIYEDGQCLSLVPGPCTTIGNEGPGAINCVKNSECVEGQCRCKARYKQDKFGLCVKPFGHECQYDNECQNVRSELACVNNTCGCPDLLQVYNREREVCLGLVGSRCQMVDTELIKYKLTLIGDSEVSSNNVGGWGDGDSTDFNGNGNENGNIEYSDDNALSWCTDGAECKPFGSLAEFGRIGECICIEGSIQTSDKTCLKEKEL